MDLNITNEELEALKLYRTEKYEAINQMLVSNSETDIALLSDEVEKRVVLIQYDRESVIEYLKNIKLIYRLILKKYYQNKLERGITVYRGTNLAEIELIKREPFIDRFLMTTKIKSDAEGKYSSNWNRPACMNIKLASNIPYINVGEVLKNKKYKNEILINPFTKIKSILEDTEKIMEKNSKLLKVYNVELEKQKLDGLSEKERNGLYSYILDNSYSIKRRLEECITLEKDNATNFENIRKLEQLLNKYEMATYEEDDEKFDETLINEDAVDDIERITKELKDLKRTSTNLSEFRKDNINFVNMWKRNIAVYMIAECKEIEKEFEAYEYLENDSEQSEEQVENLENNTKQGLENEEEKIVQKSVDNNNSEKIEKSKEDSSNKDDENNSLSQETKVIEIVKSTSKEENNEKEYQEAKDSSEYNLKEVEKLLNNIKLLISKQQNHAKIAGNLGASYSALNSAFDMKKYTENLLELVKNIDLKVQSLKNENDDMTKVNLKRISNVNKEICVLMNYLNNPRIATSNSQITRFDEMAIIEENELKRAISEKIRDIRGEAELKKLKDDLEIINSKGAFVKFIGMFTGKNKLDDFMIDQIELRQNAIRKTLSNKLSLAHNYSIHEMLAEISMFINDNEDDELVEWDVIELKSIAEELKRNFVILDSKVQSAVVEREGRNLPVKSKRLSKKDVIEIETYRFLNKYGYDIDRKDSEEPKYQDTMANEISRIIEYINSSNVF